MHTEFRIEIPEDDENQPNHSSPPPTPRGDLSPPELPHNNPSFPQTPELHPDTINNTANENNEANEQQEASGNHYPYSHNGYSGAYGCAHM